MLTVGEIMRRLGQQFGSAWDPGAALSFGSPEAAVTGIAVSWTPTLEVLKRAAGAHHTLLLTLQPPFWNGKAPEGRSPGPSELAADATYQAKAGALTRHHLNVLVVREGWLAREEDGQLRGLAQALGWEGHYRPLTALRAWSRDNNRFTLPESSLGELARGMGQRLNARSLRCIGNPATRISRVALTHGYFLVADAQKALAHPDFDLLVTGEACEWEAAPYFMDVIASGQKKAVIMLGNQVSSEPGCGELAAWTRGLVPEVPVEWIAAGEPFAPVSRGVS